MDILQELSKLKTAAELTRALATLQKLMRETEDRIDALRSELGAAIRKGAAQDQKFIKEKLRNEEDRYRDLEVTAESLPAEIETARQIELSAQMEAKHADAIKLQKGIFDLYIELDKHCSAAAPLLREIPKLTEQFRLIDMALSEAGRQDLVLHHPLSILSEYLRRQNITLPTTIPEYFPPHPDGAALSRISEILALLGRLRKKSEN